MDNDSPPKKEADTKNIEASPMDDLFFIPPVAYMMGTIAEISTQETPVQNNDMSVIENYEPTPGDTASMDALESPTTGDMDDFVIIGDE